jgi:3-mercaptopyruvate sulfurtransferase SseA
VALQLRRHGIRNVRPLLGGYHAWKDLGYPLEVVAGENEAGASDAAVATEDLAS